MVTRARFAGSFLPCLLIAILWLAGITKIEAQSIEEISVLAAQARGDDAEIAVRAIAELANRGQQGVKPLIGALRGCSEARIASADALSGILADSKDVENVVGALSDNLKDSDVRVQVASANALRAIGPAAITAIEKLIPQLDPAVSTWEVRRGVADVLARFRAGAQPAIVALNKLLEDQMPSVQISAADALREIGPNASSAVPNLIKLLDSSDKNIQQSAADALGKILVQASSEVPNKAKVVQKLAQLLSDEGTPWEVYQSSAFSLRLIGPDTKALDSLLLRIKHEKFEVRQAVVDAIGSARSGDLKFVQALLERLRKDEEIKVRISATDALARLGPDAASARVALIELIQTEGVREVPLVRSAIDALGQIGFDTGFEKATADKLVDNLIRLTTDSDSLLRGSAADALAQFGLRADDRIVSALTDLLEKEPEYVVRRSAAYALRETCDPARNDAKSNAVRKQLFRILADRHGDVRRAAAEAIAQIRPDINGIEPLIKVLGDRDWVVRRSAACALAEIRPPPVIQLVTAISEAKSQSAFLIRQSASDSLSRIPTMAKFARDNKIPHAASSDGAKGSEGALPDLAAALANSDARSDIEQAMTTITRGIKADLDSLSENQLNTIEKLVQDSINIVDRLASGALANDNLLRSLQDTVAAIEKLRTERANSKIINKFAAAAYAYPIVSVMMIWYLAAILIWFALTRIYPAKIVPASEWMCRRLDVLTIERLGFNIPLKSVPRAASGLVLFDRTSRVLKVWTNGAADIIINTTTNDDQFKNDGMPDSWILTVKSGLPLRSKADLADGLANTFQKDRFQILVCGPDSQLANLAARMIASMAMAIQSKLCRHRMIPVELDAVDLENFKVSPSKEDKPSEPDVNIDTASDKPYSLFHLVAASLQWQLSLADQPSENLVRELLRQRRLLIVIKAHMLTDIRCRRIEKIVKDIDCLNALVLVSDYGEWNMTSTKVVISRKEHSTGPADNENPEYIPQS